MANDSPEVLLVDDNLESVRQLATLVEAAGSRCHALGPSDVSREDLQSADLVVVDYTLDEWLGLIPNEPIAVRPPDGIALSGLFRQYSDKKAPPTGYALITGKGGSLGPLPAERRPHVISRLSNVEWFFEKQASQNNTARQIADLARAIRSLPANVKQDLSDVAALVRFLGVKTDDPFFDRYCDTVSRCRPPLHHLSERSHGLVLIRWLLHRILPHTCFLFDALHLAARLRVTPDSLQICLSEKESLVGELGASEYHGPLAWFDGPRWWRGGIEQWLWKHTNGQSADDEKILEVLQSLGCRRLVPAAVVQPVVTVDKDLMPERRLSSFADTVPIRLDDWPDYAEPAYATKQTLEENPEMRAFASD